MQESKSLQIKKDLPLNANLVKNTLDFPEINLIKLREILNFSPSPLSLQIDESDDLWDSSKGIWKNHNTVHVPLEFSQPLYIFGYGSLCWNIAPELRNCPFRKVYIKGYQRRFWQMSTDHRGTTQSPGLVCTLISDEEYCKLEGVSIEKSSLCYGLAFEVEKSKEKEVIEALDYREKGGYIRVPIKMYLVESDKEIEGIVYTGESHNPNFLCRRIRSNIIDCAKIIEKSEGPSGKNYDYLMKLVRFLQENSFKDDYVFRLAEIVEMFRKRYRIDEIYEKINLCELLFDISIDCLEDNLPMNLWVWKISFKGIKDIPLENLISWMGIFGANLSMAEKSNSKEKKFGVQFYIFDNQKNCQFDIFKLFETFCLFYIKIFS